MREELFEEGVSMSGDKLVVKNSKSETKLDEIINTSTTNSATTTTTTTTTTSTSEFKSNEQPKQLTIQDAFDPENVTVHMTSSNTSYWLADNEKKPKPKQPKWAASSENMAPQQSNANPLPSVIGFSKLFPLNKLAKSSALDASSTSSDLSKSQTPQSKQPFKSNFNFFSNNFLNLTLKQRPLVPTASISSTLNKNGTNRGSYIMDLNNNNFYKSSMVKYKTVSAIDTKYIDYKRKWIEYLKKERKVFDAKWSGTGVTSASATTSTSNEAISVAQQQTKFEDYELKKTLGNGSFGRVILVKHRANGKFYALKVLIKKNVVKSRQIEHTVNEKRITSSVNFPFIAGFAGSFKDTTNLYIVLEFVPGGEMFKHLVRLNKFTEWQTKFYCAQVVLAIEYLHSLDILHRDLKPENTLIAHDGYIKISDFGFAKYVKTRTYTLCGTPEYLAPEIIQSKPYGKAVDWWAVGILTYEMSVGKPPFQSDQPIKIYEKILSGKYKVPQTLSDELRDFMRCLIQPDLTKRYGNLRNGVDDVKTHKWFSGLDWMAVFNKRLTAPMIPKLKHAGDASNFDAYDEEPITVGKEMLYEKEFADF